MGTPIFLDNMLSVFVLNGNDLWENMGLELLILGRVGIIKSSLLEWDISADKRDQSTVLLAKRLNYRN